MAEQIHLATQVSVKIRQSHQLLCKTVCSWSLNTVQEYVGMGKANGWAISPWQCKKVESFGSFPNRGQGLLRLRVSPEQIHPLSMALMGIAGNVQFISSPQCKVLLGWGLISIGQMMLCASFPSLYDHLRTLLCGISTIFLLHLGAILRRYSVINM
jgi:hypothetical protein